LRAGSNEGILSRSPSTVNVFVRALLRRLLGDRGEREAARWLRRQGFRILVRGYRTPRGEIDLIAREGDTVVFVGTTISTYE